MVRRYFSALRTNSEYLEDLDKSVDPCTDFYEFGNGSWRKANPTESPPRASVVIDGVASHAVHAMSDA